MPTLENLAVLFLIATGISAAVFGTLAWSQVDPEKKRSAPRGIVTWGPQVSESVLTPKGREYAFVRNIAVLVFFLGGLATGIILNLVRH